MTTGKIVPIEIGGGARFNLREPDADDPRLWEDTAKDLAVALRGRKMNRDLGITDTLLAAGEWGLAMEEMLAVIADEREQGNPVVGALANRAAKLLADEAKSKEIKP